jgi:tetratricopeptide (TPR) repeat protein
MAHYERALEANPDYAEAHFNLGNALVQSGQPESAIRHYHQALRLKPEYLDARYNLGVLLANDGQYDKAIQLLQGGLTEPNSQRFRRAIEEAKQARSTKIGRQVAD